MVHSDIDDSKPLDELSEIEPLDSVVSLVSEGLASVEDSAALISTLPPPSVNKDVESSNISPVAVPAETSSVKYGQDGSRSDEQRRGATWVTFHNPFDGSSTTKVVKRWIPDEDHPIGTVYQSPTAETATLSSGASLRAMSIENFVLDGTELAGASSGGFVMSGALDDIPIILPSLPRNDQVRDRPKASRLQTTKSIPQKARNVEANHIQFSEPQFSRNWLERDAFDYLSFSSSRFIRRRRPRKRVQVLANFPGFHQYNIKNYKRTFTALEIRSDLPNGTEQGKKESNYHWQLVRYYTRYEELDIIEEEGPLGEIVPERPPPFAHNTFFEHFLNDEEILHDSGFEHLKNGNFKFDARYDKGTIVCVDYLTGAEIPRFRSSTWDAEVIDPADLDSTWDLENMQLDRLIKELDEPPPENVETRLIIVEDLSHTVIEFLGTRFHVSPEFFEEHLLNSGYKDGLYQDFPIDSWNTFGVPKDYTSIKWYRPAIRIEDVPPISNRSEEDLLQGLPLEYETEEGHKLIYKSDTNIFRAKWDLQTDPSTPLSGNRACGWEEKASIWSGHIENCRIVILVLDPLPTLARGVIVRSIETASYFTSDSIVVVDEESAEPSIRHDKNGRPIKPKKTHIMSRPAPKVPTRFERLAIRFLRWTKRKKNVVDENGSEDTAHLVRTFRKIETVQIIQHTGTRAYVGSDYPTAFSSNEKLHAFDEKVSTTRPTMTDFLEWLNSPVFGDSHQISPLGSATPLLQLVISDTSSLCGMIHNGLNQIGQDIVDEGRLEESLYLWRQFIGRCQRELPELEQTILRLHETLCPTFDTGKISEGGQLNHNSSYRSKAILTDIQLEAFLKRIKQLREEVDRSSSSLTSNMSLLDSKRSIQEAQSVTKLTELAFLFIPATFGASIFGMQVDVFENRAPLWVFFVLIIVLTTIAYTFRLIIRSQTMTYTKSRAKESILVYAKELKVPYRRGQSVPTGLFLSWVLFNLSNIPGYLVSRLGSGILSLCALFGFWVASGAMISALSAAPLAALLTRHHIRSSVKTGLGIMIVTIATLIVIIPYWRFSSPKFRSALLVMISRALASIFDSGFLRLSLLWLLALGIAIMPFIVLWTRELSIGIKAAVTALLGLALIASMFAALIYRLVSIANTRFVEDSDDESLMD